MTKGSFSPHTGGSLIRCFYPTHDTTSVLAFLINRFRKSEDPGFAPLALCLGLLPSVQLGRLCPLPNSSFSLLSYG
jgi:hypothetical protein